MKKVKTIFAVLFLALISLDSNAQKFKKLDESIMDMSYYPDRAAFRNFAKTEAEKKAGEPIMRVTYSRPLKKGRDIFPELVKYGEVWRLGANEATELLVMQPVSLGGTKLEPGRYTMYALVNEANWEIHVSTDLDTWGQYSFDPTKSTIAKISVPTEKTADVVEAFSIYFEKIDDNTAHMIMGWDDTMVRVPFKI